MPGALLSAAVRLPVWLDGRRAADLDNTTREARTDELLALAAQCGDNVEYAQERQSFLDEVVLLNGPIAEAIAGRYRARGIDSDDLVQVAYLGLVKASQGYRQGEGPGFLAYAVPTISGEIKRHFRDFGWMVRPPRRVQELRSAALAAASELLQHLGTSPSAQVLAEAVGVSIEDIAEAAMADGCFNAVSLDAPGPSEAGPALGEQLVDDDDPYDRIEMMEMLRPVLRSLSDRDRRILLLRFVRGCTQEQIGEEIGVSQMQVSRLLTRILRDLREELTDDPEPESAT